jgi:hypothetical protein
MHFHPQSPTHGGRDERSLQWIGCPPSWRNLNTEKQAPFLARQMSKCDDTSTGAATRAAHCGSLLEGLGFLYAQARWTQGFLSGSGVGM